MFMIFIFKIRPEPDLHPLIHWAKCGNPEICQKWQDARRPHLLWPKSGACLPSDSQWVRSWHRPSMVFLQLWWFQRFITAVAVGLQLYEIMLHFIWQWKSRMVALCYSINLIYRPVRFYSSYQDDTNLSNTVTSAVKYCDLAYRTLQTQDTSDPVSMVWFLRVTVA